MLIQMILTRVVRRKLPVVAAELSLPHIGLPTGGAAVGAVRDSDASAHCKFKH